MSTLADRVRSARVAAGIQEPADLARRVGVKAAAAYQWESGATKSLKAETAIVLAEVLGVSIKWLVTGKGPRAATGGGVDRHLLTRAILIGHRETAGRKFSDEQKAAVIAFLYARFVEGAGTDAARDIVLGMLHAFTLENVKAP